MGLVMRTESPVGRDQGRVRKGSDEDGLIRRE